MFEMPSSMVFVMVNQTAAEEIVVFFVCPRLIRARMPQPRQSMRSNKLDMDATQRALSWTQAKPEIALWTE